MNNIQTLLLELDKLKSVYRKSYISDNSRPENSAEHSWHLAMALMAFKPFLPAAFNLDYAVRMALAHDVCEIGAGDICAYNRDVPDKAEKEADYLKVLASQHPEFGSEMMNLWEEYEGQLTIESQWVKLVDMLLPFLLNLATNGRTWHEQKISFEMVRQHNLPIKVISPEVYDWMMSQLDMAAGIIGLIEPEPAPAHMDL